MKLTIRLDDITPGMNWVKFERMRQLLEKFSVLPVIGVVPRCEDPKLQIDPERDDFWVYVKQLQDAGWTVALHGWKHVYTTKDGGLFPLNLQSEFAGLAYERQRQMLEDGQRVLRSNDILTDVFMAPSHTYDLNTLKAMRACGLTRMTDGFGRRPYFYKGIAFYPISMDRKKSLEDTGNDITTLVYHSNTMKEQDFQALEQILQTQEVIPYSDYLMILPEIRTEAGHLQEYLLAAAKRTVIGLRR